MPARQHRPSTWKRARFLVESKDLQGAVQEYTRALELAPVAEAYAGRALLAKKLGRTSEALADYTKAVQIAPIVDYYVQQAALYEQAGDVERARASYNSAIELRPDVPYTYRARATLRERLHDVAGAQKDREIADQIEKPIVNEPLPGKKAKKADSKTAPEEQCSVSATPPRVPDGKSHRPSRG